MNFRTDALQTGDFFGVRKVHILLLRLANLGTFGGNARSGVFLRQDFYHSLYNWMYWNPLLSRSHGSVVCGIRHTLGCCTRSVA